MMAQTSKIIRRRRVGGGAWRIVGGVVLAVAGLHGNSVRADEFRVTVQIRQGKQKIQAASAPTQASAGKKLVIKPRLKIGERNKPRPLLRVHAGQTVWVRWQVTATGSSETFKDLLVHIFSVEEAQAGQAKVPKLTKSAAYESALSMDFKPKDQAHGRFQLKFTRPGVYLIRVETIGLANKLEREFHAAADVQVLDAVKAAP